MVDLRTVSLNRLELILIKKLVKRGAFDKVFFKLLRHRVNILNELKQELLHVLCCKHKLHDLRLTQVLLPLAESTSKMEILIEALDGFVWVDCLFRL